jgi:redox-sensitive bicupin YhaK (pirin superfamily)
MLLRIPGESIHTTDHGWFRGRFHFSYADYKDPGNTHFGVLRALNEFVLQPGSGFEPHPHAEIEIISYCVQGELTHGDDLGYRSTLRGGDIQYLRAGSGIMHREMNETKDQLLRFYQIWIAPLENGLEPKYENRHIFPPTSPNKLQHVASGEKVQGVIQIAQDANLYTARLASPENMTYSNRANRQSYLTCLDGTLIINELKLNQHDALKVRGEETLHLKAQEDSHLLMVDMAAER